MSWSKVALIPAAKSMPSAQKATSGRSARKHVPHRLLCGRKQQRATMASYGLHMKRRLKFLLWRHCTEAKGFITSIQPRVQAEIPSMIPASTEKALLASFPSVRCGMQETGRSRARASLGAVGAAPRAVAAHLL